MSINEYIVSAERLYAHTDSSGIKDKETLIAHSELTLLFYTKIQSENGIDNVLDQTLNRLTFGKEHLNEDVKQFIKNLFQEAIYLHDLGKVNPAFQRVKMKNKEVAFKSGSEYSDTNHALLSALLYLDIFSQEVAKWEDEEIRGFLYHVLYTFSYVISRHHTYLEDVHSVEFHRRLFQLHQKIQDAHEYVAYYTFKDRLLSDFSVKQFADIDNFRFEDGHEDIPFYLLTKLLFSSIVSCDFLATYTYYNDSQPTFYYLQQENIAELLSIYQETDVSIGINSYKHDKSYFNDYPINALRSDLFVAAEEELMKHSDRNLFYLEAPTGSGKTNMSLNLSLQLLKENEQTNKLVYVFPFNTLIEQTKQTLSGIYSEKIQEKYRISVVNSVTPIVTKKEQELDEPTIDYEEELLRRQMLQYPVTLTSHVNFFNYLFGVGRESNLALVYLCNSVVILDEIQSYRNIIWTEIIHFLREISECFNIKFVIMSATLPRLDELLHEENQFVELIKDREKYFQHPLFKERVQLHFELLKDKAFTLDTLLEQVDDVISNRETSRVLIECISKKTARQCYNMVKERFGETKVIELTGDDSNYYRKTVLDQISKKLNGKFILDNVIVVATQVIEAGVDIDMDIGFKDISLLDAEEQFLGRINRSCLRSDCHVYFFDLDKAEKVYRNDFRIEKNLLMEEYQESLREKNFTNFYRLNFQRLDERSGKQNVTNIKNFFKLIHELEFGKVAKHMELITEKTLTLFIAYQLEIQNGEVINGEELWDEYKELLNDKVMNYAEKQVELSRLKEQMTHFTYTLYSNGKPHPPRFDDNLGTMFCVRSGEQYMEVDSETGMKKFNRKSYIDGSGSMFL